MTTIKELYKNREDYLDKEVTIGGMGTEHQGFQDVWVYCCKRRFLF